MNMVTHVSFGLLLTLAAAAALNPGISGPTLTLYLIVAAVGSVFPDIDHPKAFISRSHWMLHGASHLLDVFTHHRGATHSLLGLLVSSSAAAGGLKYANLSPLLALPFALGYLSHLMADTINPQGVKWLQPLSQWNPHLKRKIMFFTLAINTGSLTERLLGALLGLTFIYAYTNWFLF